MDLNTLQRIAVESLEDIKAQDIKAYDTTGQTSEFDRVIVATGGSTRQTRALAWHVAQTVKAAGGYVGHIEGADTGEWVLVDLGDIVLHLMVAPIRAYYALEDIWGAHPTAIKPPLPKKRTATAKKTRAPKEVKPASTKTAAKKRSSAAKKAVTKTAQPRVKQTSPATAKKTTTAKTPLRKKTSAKQPDR
ncbi:MAG TPA: ribosome silencing factor [Burkholderiaceae bacterium]|nr:ribosome silencing factor [Burkholderiaceae bacterium]